MTINIGAITAYSLKVSIVMMALWLIYRLLLARENQPAFNRCMILVIYAISFLAPLLPTFKHITFNHTDVLTQVQIEGISVEFIEPSEPVTSTGLFMSILAIIYLSGVVISLIYTLIGWFKVKRLVTTSEYQNFNNAKLVITDGQVFTSPFSWLNYIVISRKDYESNGRDMILTHELKHIELKHPLDVILAQLTVIFCWFNPASYLMRSDLRDVHEYQADIAVLESGADACQYQLLLIKKAVGNKFPAIANSFNHSKLKKRLTMMSNKNNSSRSSKMRAIALIPTLGIALVALNCAPVVNAFSKLTETSFDLATTPKNEDKITDFVSENQIFDEAKVSETPVEEPTLASVEPSVEAVNAVRDDNTPSNKVFTSAQKMPQFPVGEVALLKYVMQNIKYPESEINSNKQGRTVVSFVVEADGKIGETKILRSLSPAFDAEAIRVIKSLPDFIPGEVDGKKVAVWYNIPIQFKTKSSTDDKAQSAPVSSASSNVLTSAQVMPQFPGGETALLDFIVKNIKYPESEIGTDKSTRVIVRFIVGADGKVRDPQILRGKNQAFNEEAIRVINMLPDFKPGENNGQKVATYYNLPISFKATSTPQNDSIK